MNTLRALLCLSLISAIRGESTSAEGYNQRSYGAESPGRRIGENPNPRDQISKFLGPGTEGDVDEGEDRPNPRREIVDPEVTDQLEGNGWLDVIPGTPGKDYPNYQKIPETSFTCDDKTPGGYYADIEARCQVFHVCNTGGQKSSFVCPSGSIFNQKYFVCDWWYDFECDDATDLYSLNEKVNRGGTGSGPSGPGRVEQSGEYSSEDVHFPGEELQNEGNFVSADGFDLSLAGTGEGGPGYARNGNNKGYQSNVNDEDRDEKRNGENEGQGRRRKNFNPRKTAGQSSKADYPSNPGDKSDRKNQNPRNESPRDFHQGSNRDREYFREYKQNTGAENPGINHRGNFNGQSKTDNFRNDRDEQSYGFIENRNNPTKYSSNRPSDENNGDNYPRRETQKYDNDYKNDNRNENRNGFGQRSSTGPVRNGYVSRENSQDDYNRGSSSSGSSSGFDNYKDFPNPDSVREEQGKNGAEGSPNGRQFNSDKSPAPSSGSNDNEYRNPSSGTTRPDNTRGRQRTSGGLPGGLGNGYPSPGHARELPGSDAIASSITPAEGRVYAEGDQRSANSHQKTSSGTRTPGELTDLRSVTDDQKIVFDHQSRRMQRPDFRDDNFSPEIDSRDVQSSKNRRTHPAQSSPLRNDKPFDSNYHRDRNGQNTDQRHQSSGKNYGNDYLVGIVPGTEDRGNGTSDPDQPRRFLPIL